MGEFGDKFRRTRELKELSLDEVSNATKINRRMLQAIEEEHFDQLPGGVFNRGFIRAYAKHLGLNSEDAVSDYLACLSQAQIDSHNGWDAERLPDPHEPAVLQPGTARSFKPVAKVEQPPVQVEELPQLQLPRMEHVRRPRKQYLHRYSSVIPWISVGAVVCVVMAGLFFWTRHNGPPAHATSTPAPAPRPSMPAPVSTPSQPVATRPASAVPVAPAGSPSASANSLTTAAGSPSASANSSTTAEATPPPANPTPGPATPAETEQDPNAVKVANNDDVTIRSYSDAAARPAEKPVVTLTLVVRASKNTWISVTSDGHHVARETLIAPAATTFHAARELVVQVGNAAGVSFVMNDQELPAQGAEGEAKTFTFDAQGMHAAESPQPPPRN